MQEAAQKTMNIMIDLISLFLLGEKKDLAAFRKSTEQQTNKKSRKGPPCPFLLSPALPPCHI
jgi:hypothetical protein